jgi:iron(III) transport system ATP-binding protein
MELHIEGLSKSYPAARILDDLALTVASGERVVILGPSGVGKTTLLRLIAGLDVPEAGEIRLAGQVVTGPGVDVPPHRRGLAYVAQFPGLFPHMTVLDNIAFGVAGERAARRARAAALLQELELTGLAERYPDQLSGGQAKRAALARALAPQRALLLLDEPLTHVEPALRDALLAVVRAHVAADSATLVYVSHDPAEATQMAPRCLVLTAGRLLPFASIALDPDNQHQSGTTQ